MSVLLAARARACARTNLRRCANIQYIKAVAMSFRSSSDFNNGAGSYNSGAQQFFMDPQPSVGRFPTEVPTFYAKGSSGSGTSAIPGVAISMAPKSSQGNLQDQPQVDPRNPPRFNGSSGAKLFNALPTKTKYSK